LTSAETAQKQLALSERAWVSVQASMFGSIWPDANGLNFPLRFVMINHGPSVALRVRLKVKIYVQEPNQDPLKDEVDTCNKIPAFVETPFFPTESRTEQANWGFGNDQIDKVRRGRPSYLQRGMFLNPWLIGCVAYTYLLAEPKDHATGFSFNIEASHPEHPGFAFAIDPTQTTPGFLREETFGGGFFAD
jgi:hypothetical protein